ncbi:MAG: hypothetical protein R3192_12935 [Woeseiaceae bacterium]|nr:hypothetical protein [Woeseiaceae bacterium]
MDLATLSGATTIALASTIVFLLIVRSWQLVSQTAISTSRFPDSIMHEAAQRFRDQLETLSRQQTIYLSAALVFMMIFAVAYTFPPQGMFEELPRWQLILVLVLFAAAAIYTPYRLLRIILKKRYLGFVRDANIATGHALQKLNANQNRLYHDVPTDAGIIDNVVVGQHGIYAVHVVPVKPRKDNEVSLRGDRLTFSDKKVMSVARVGVKSAQLAKEIGKVLGHNIRVRSVVVVPGWEVDSQASEAYLAVNERNLTMLTGWKDPNDYLMNEDVDTVQNMLSERCRRYKKTKKGD